jgi:hypothetical protein
MNMNRAGIGYPAAPTRDFSPCGMRLTVANCRQPFFW